MMRRGPMVMTPGFGPGNGGSIPPASTRNRI